MSRKRRAQRPARPASAGPGAEATAGPVDANPTPEAGPAGDAAAASMRDAMRAALDAKASRQGRAPVGGQRPGPDGTAGRGGGAKGFRALPRRNAG